MELKKFLQIVEEENNRGLQKNKPRLKWEQKLEAATKAKAEADANLRENLYQTQIVIVTALMEGER